MGEIRSWLNQFGLEKYAPIFAANDIDSRVLPELTDTDLRELGVSLGHRKILLKAIAELETSRSTEPRPQFSEAERRQLTVMFCDLVGSTEMSSRLDPEELREIIGLYQKTCGEVINRYGGFIAQFLGDGIVVYFGYPKAQEDAAERAIRSALTIVNAVAKLHHSSGEKISVRIGIATGLAVVGDQIGKGSSEQTNVIGQTPNLAARIQALAQPGCIAISESTRKLSGELFDYEPLGPQDLKGIDGQVNVFRVIGEQSISLRFDATRSALTKCVGRDNELRIMLEAWSRAKSGNGQGLLVSGEPGIGKSRLIQSLINKLEGETFLHVVVQCSPMHANTPLYPVLNSIQRVAKITLDDAPSDQYQKLKYLLEQGNCGHYAPLFASIMSIPHNSLSSATTLPHEGLKEKILDVCTEFVLNLAENQPVLYQLEDAHWIDPTTEDLMARLLERISDHRVLLQITARNEYQPFWMNRPEVTHIEIPRLLEKTVREMATSVAGGKALPEKVMLEILDKTDGVPLFVEEMTRNILESGFLSPAENSWTVNRPLPSMTIPSSIQDSLMARLDRLSSAKETLQVAAVIGRTFSYDMLAAVIDQPEVMLNSALERLVAAELIFQHGHPPIREYRFKHALIMETAYASLLKSKRSVLHGRIARILESKFSDIAKKQPEIVAHHASRAEMPEKAITHWILAGKRSLERSAYKEAITLLTHAQETLSLIHDDDHRMQTELEIQLALGQASIGLHGYGAPETKTAFERAHYLLKESRHQTDDYFDVLYGLLSVDSARGNLLRSDSLSQEFLTRARETDKNIYLCVAHRLIGYVAFYDGRLSYAKEQLGLAISYYGDAYSPELTHRFGVDSKVMAENFCAMIETLMGNFNGGLKKVEDAIYYSKSINHNLSIAQALHTRSSLMLIQQDYSGLLESDKELRAFSVENKLGYFEFMSGLTSALAEAYLGDCESFLSIYRHRCCKPEIANTLTMWRFHLAAAELLLKRELPDEAFQAVQRAMLIAENGERWGEAESERIYGECLLRLSPLNQGLAEKSFRTAIDVAQSMGASTYELRAAQSLYKILVSDGREAEGQNLLARAQFCHR